MLNDIVKKRVVILENLRPEGYIPGTDGSLAFVTRPSYHRPSANVMNQGEYYRSPPMPIGSAELPTYVILSPARVERMVEETSPRPPNSTPGSSIAEVRIGRLDLGHRRLRGNIDAYPIRPGEEVSILPCSFPSSGARVEDLPPVFATNAARNLEEPLEVDVAGRRVRLSFGDVTFGSQRSKSSLSSFQQTLLEIADVPFSLVAGSGLMAAGLAGAVGSVVLLPILIPLELASDGWEQEGDSDDATDESERSPRQ